MNTHPNYKINPILNETVYKFLFLDNLSVLNNTNATTTVEYSTTFSKLITNATNIPTY